MAYNLLFFSCGRSEVQNNATPITSAIHTYISATETMATILGGSYFPSYFGFDSSFIKNGDILFISSSDDMKSFAITSASSPTLSGNLSPAYLFDFDLSLTWANSSWASSQTGNFNFLVNNDTCLLYFQGVSATASSFNTITTSLGISSIYPAITFNDTFMLTNPVGSASGRINIDTGGTVTITAYTGGGSPGTYGFPTQFITYPVALVKG